MAQSAEHGGAAQLAWSSALPDNAPIMESPGFHALPAFHCLIASGLAQAGDLIDEFGVADRLDQVPPNIKHICMDIASTFLTAFGSVASGAACADALRAHIAVWLYIYVQARLHGGAVRRWRWELVFTFLALELAGMPRLLSASPNLGTWVIENALPVAYSGKRKSRIVRAWRMGSFAVAFSPDHFYIRFRYSQRGPPRGEQDHCLLSINPDIRASLRLLVYMCEDESEWIH